MAKAPVSSGQLTEPMGCLSDRRLSASAMRRALLASSVSARWLLDGLSGPLYAQTSPASGEIPAGSRLESRGSAFATSRAFATAGGQPSATATLIVGVRGASQEPSSAQPANTRQVPNIDSAATVVRTPRMPPPVDPVTRPNPYLNAGKWTAQISAPTTTTSRNRAATHLGVR